MIFIEKSEQLRTGSEKRPKSSFRTRDGQWDLNPMGFESRDTNPGTWDRDWDWFSWDAWDWDKYRWDSPGTKISGTAKSQALGPLGTLKSLGQKSLVPSHAHPWSKLQRLETGRVSAWELNNHFNILKVQLTQP